MRVLKADHTSHCVRTVMSDLDLASREGTEEESAPSVRRGPNAAHPACATRVAPSPLLAMADASVAIRRLRGNPPIVGDGFLQRRQCHV
jgi:hypothetical protein